MILKLGMHHRGLKLYKVNINDDPGLTLIITPMSNWVTWKTITKSFDEGKLAAKD